MIKWKKPNGTIISTNDFKGTVETAVSLGWKEVSRDSSASSAAETNKKAQGKSAIAASTDSHEG